MKKEQLDILIEELAVKIITANPHLAHPIIRAIAGYFIRITVRYLLGEAEIFIKFSRIDFESNQSMKELQVARHKLRIALLQGSDEEIKNAEAEFKNKFDTFISVK